MRIAVALLGLTVVGCATDEREEATGEVTSAVVVNNRLAANRHAANRLAANRLAANRLAANRLAANKLELNNVGANELLATEEGREVLGFIVSCAIKEGQTLIAEFDGNTYEFFGEIGLANRWLDHPIDDEGAGWVSACLFARVNASNVPIPISLRGKHKQLEASQEEKAGWTLQEGGFYGNFFTEDDEPIDWNACTGSDQAAGETGRDCAEPDGNTGLTKCGFKYTGNCGAFAAPGKFACKKFDSNGTFYERCASEPGFEQKPNGNIRWTLEGNDDFYRQVITVYLQP